MKDFKDAIAKPRFVALYASLTVDDFVTVYGVDYVDYDEHYSPLPDGQLRERPLDGWVRITDPLKVEFAAIDNDSIVRHAVESLNEAERKAIEELNRKIAQIRERKNQLLALTHEVTP